jgi:ABC-2 type transport system permease protein
VYSIALAFSLTNFVILAVYADPDWGMLITTYLGYWLAGAALISAGMFASVLTSNVTVAFVVGAVMCAVPVFVGIGTSHPLPDDASFGQRFGDTLVQFGQELSLGERLREFNLGVVPFSGLIYFGSVIAFFLYLNAGMIGRRHWVQQTGVPVGLHFGVRAVCLVVALIAGNSIVSTASESMGLRFDMTSEKIYTLSETTSEVLDNVKKENPVTIQAFLSPYVPREFVSHHTQLRGLLRQYSRQAGSRVEVRFVDVGPYSKEADEAERLGIQSQEVASEVNGRFERMQIFMGAFIQSEFDQVVIPFFEQGASIEYELTRSISTVTQKDRLTVGILRTDAQVNGGFDQSTFRQIPAWRIQAELAKQYEVKDVSAVSPIVDDIDMLIAVLPSSLTDSQMGNFVEYVNSGKPVLILDDPFPYNDLMVYGQPRNAPSQPKQAPQRNLMFGGGGPQPEPRADGGKATRLTNALNIEWQNDQIVFDRTNPHPQFRDSLEDEFVFIHRNKSNPEAISTKSELTSGLEEVLVILAGSIKPRARVKNDTKPGFIPLLWTGADDSGEVDFRTLLTSLRLREPPNREDDDEAHVIAARIAGEKTIAKEQLRKILASFRINLADLSEEDLAKRIKEVEKTKAADRNQADQRFWLVAKAKAAQEEFNKGDRKAEQVIYEQLIDDTTKDVASKKQFDQLMKALDTITDTDRTGPDTDINTIYVADVDIISDMMFNVAQTEVQGLKLDNVRFILNCVDFLAGDDKYVSLRNRRGKFRVLKYLDEQVREFREKAEAERIKAGKDAEATLKKKTRDLDKEIDAIRNNDELSDTEKQQRVQMAVEKKRRQLEVDEGKIERTKEAKLKQLDTRVKRQTQEEESTFRFHAVFWPPIPAIVFGIVFLILRISSERMSIEETRRLK